MNTNASPAAQWRFLKPGETIQEGDEFTFDACTSADAQAGWVTAPAQGSVLGFIQAGRVIGQFDGNSRYGCGDGLVRRRVTEHPEAAPAPEAPTGKPLTIDELYGADFRAEVARDCFRIFVEQRQYAGFDNNAAAAVACADALIAELKRTAK